MYSQGDIELIKNSITEILNSLDTKDKTVQNACNALSVEKNNMDLEKLFLSTFNNLDYLLKVKEISETLQEYYDLCKFQNNQTANFCRLISELSGESFAESHKTDYPQEDRANVLTQLRALGISSAWLVSHGFEENNELASEEHEHTDINFIQYKHVKNGVRIDAVETGGNIELPDYIDNMPVIAINDSVFFKRKDVYGVKLPKHLERIGKCAFQNSNITYITIPNSVMRIGEKAFSDCKFLVDVVLPNSLVTIQDRLFQGCSKLESIEIPKSVTTINNYAFCNCPKLKKLYVPTTVKRFTWGGFVDSRTTIECELNSPVYRHLKSHYHSKIKVLSQTQQ